MKVNKKLILSLIKDDLINYRLVSALDKIGLDPGNYFLYLSGTIFSLIGFSKEDREKDVVHDLYTRLFGKVRKIDIQNEREKLDELALEVYTELIVLRESMKK